MIDRAALDLHDWGSDLISVATSAKIAALTGDHISLFCPSFLKVQDTQRQRKRWSEVWETHRQTIHMFDLREEPTYFPETGDGYYYDNTACSQMEPDWEIVDESEVAKHFRFYANPRGITLPKGVLIPPRSVDALTPRQRLAYQDLVLLEDENRLTARPYLDSEKLAVSTFLPSLFDVATADFAKSILALHPFPEDLVNYAMKVSTWPVCEETSTSLSWSGRFPDDNEQRQIIVRRTCALAGSRLASVVLPKLELRTAAEILELRDQVADSLEAFQSRVRELADRSIALSLETSAYTPTGFSQILWQLENEYENLKRAASSSRFWALARDSAPTFASSVAGLSLTLTAGVLTGGSALALGASATAIPVAHVAKTCIDWIRKARANSRDPLYWRYRLDLLPGGYTG